MSVCVRLLIRSINRETDDVSVPTWISKQKIKALAKDGENVQTDVVDFVQRAEAGRVRQPVVL